jgi:hypothetical protein
MMTFQTLYEIVNEQRSQLLLEAQKRTLVAEAEAYAAEQTRQARQARQAAPIKAAQPRWRLALRQLFAPQ